MQPFQASDDVRLGRQAQEEIDEVVQLEIGATEVQGHEIGEAYDEGEAMKRLARQISEESASNAGLLPLVVFADTEDLKFKKGRGTVVPVFTIKKWVEAPPCLQAAAIATEPDDEPEDDDDEF